MDLFCVGEGELMKNRRLEYLKFIIPPVLVMVAPIALIGWVLHRTFAPEWKGALRMKKRRRIR